MYATPLTSCLTLSSPSYMEEACAIVLRVALLACSITSVKLWTLKCALFGLLQNGHHSTGDHYIQ